MNMTMTLTSPLAGAALVACAPILVVAQDVAIADTVLLGGKVLTMEAADRIVNAVAIADGKILAIGTDGEIQRPIGDETRIVRLPGRTVIPGIIAAHCHAVGVDRRHAGPSQAGVDATTGD